MTKAINAIDHHIAVRIRAARIERGLSQERLGELLGVSFQQVQKYEKASNRVSAGKLALIAGALHKPVVWFFDGAPDVNTAEADGPDLGGRFLTQHYAPAMAQAFIGLPDNASRRLIVTITEALAHRPTVARLAKAGCGAMQIAALTGYGVAAIETQTPTTGAG